MLNLIKKVVLLCILCIAIFIPTVATADNGGQADVDGKIIFYDTSSTSSTDSKASSDSNSSTPHKKPQGLFPNTGEKASRFIILLGVLILGIGILFVWFLKKRRSNNEE